jgi:hypothetical protein
MVEKFDLITSGEPVVNVDVNLERLAYARLEGPATTLSYMADDKTHVRFTQCHFVTPLNQTGRKNQ